MANGNDGESKAVEVTWNAAVKVTEGPSLSLEAKPAIKTGQYHFAQYLLGARKDTDTPTVVGHNLPEDASKDPRVIVIRRAEVKEGDAPDGLQYTLLKKDSGKGTEPHHSLVAPHFVTGPVAKTFLKDIEVIEISNKLSRAVQVDIFVAYGEAPESESSPTPGAPERAQPASTRAPKGRVSGHASDAEGGSEPKPQSDKPKS